jgi:hypothetical protein
MAIVQNTLIGRSSGRVGNAVFTQWKGRNVLKQKPEIVTNPRTALQQQQRSRFTTLMAIGKSLRPVLQLGFKEYAGSVTWLNRFMSTNTGSGLLSWNESTQSWESDFRNLVVSEGSLHPTFVSIDSVEIGPVINGDAMTDVVCQWEWPAISNQNNLDTLVVVLISGEFTTYSIRQITRNGSMHTAPTADHTFTMIDRPYAYVQPITMAAFFVSSDGRIVSGNNTFQTP